jgi:hypothetical protein
MSRELPFDSLDVQECEDKVAKLEAKVHSHERANVFIRSFVVSIGTYFFLKDITI